jgi:formylglycine-generating enzyme required for sulfatase activity
MPSATGWSANSSNGDGNGPGNGNGRAGSASAALDDPFGMRRAGREVLSLALFESRNHLLRLLALDETPDALRLAAQAGWYQEYWIARHVQRSRGEACDAQGLRLASIEPRIEAWLREDEPAPEPALLRSYLADTLETTLELLTALNDATEDDVSLHFYRCSLMHEDRLGETLATRLPWRAAAGGPPARADREALWWPAQRWILGSAPGGLVPHHERWAHEVAVPEFEIDALPVSWARYVEFAEDSGYDREDFWSAAGWSWVQQEGRRAPGRVEQLHGGVLVARGAGPSSGLQRASPAQPAMHVSRHEAEAWCRWAGRRLPTEPEWEIAASQGRSRGFAWGDVFEWVAGGARAWPGAGAPAPGSLDASPTPGHGVLRGASFATRARWRHPKARRFAAPERDDMFCGFRSCPL